MNLHSDSPHTSIARTLCFVLPLLALLADVCSGADLAQAVPGGVGVIDNRWKLNEVRKEYEEHAQLKRKEHRQAWKKQRIDASGIAWDLTDTIGMIRGDVDPRATDAEECTLDVTPDSLECLRLTVVPLRSDLTDVKVSVGAFRSVAGTTLPDETAVRTAAISADGGWELAATTTNDTIPATHRCRYLIFVDTPKSAVNDEYFGRVVLDAKEKADGKSVQLVLPMKLCVRGYGVPRGTLRADMPHLSRTALCHDVYEHFRRSRDMLIEELGTRLPRWAKTDDDKRFVDQCQVLAKSGSSVQLADVGKRTDFVTLGREVAAKLDRARLALKSDLHSVTLGRTNTAGHTILNSQLYAPSQRELVVCYTECIYKSDALVEDSKGVYLVSRNDGLNWEPYNSAGVAALSQASILPDGKNRIQAFSYGWENHPESDRAQLEAKGFYIFDAKDGNAPGVLSIDYRAGMKRSRDAGLTWETKEIKLPRFMPDLRCHMMGIALRDGTYLYPMYGRYDMNKEKYVSSLVLRTTDVGDTWEIHTIANAMNGYFDKSARGEAANGFNETSLVEASNGDVVAVIRTTDQIELWTAISKDAGKNWSEPRDSGMRGSVPFCVRTSDGCLVCIHSRREQRIFPDGTGMYAGISRDNGRTWHSICIEDAGLQFVDSYAQAVALPDGKVFTVYTAPRDGRQSSCGTLFTPGRVTPTSSNK